MGGGLYSNTKTHFQFNRDCGRLEEATSMDDTRVSLPLHHLSHPRAPTSTTRAKYPIDIATLANVLHRFAYIAGQAAQSRFGNADIRSQEHHDNVAQQPCSVDLGYTVGSRVEKSQTGSKPGRGGEGAEDAGRRRPE